MQIKHLSNGALPLAPALCISPYKEINHSLSTEGKTAEEDSQLRDGHFTLFLSRYEREERH